MAGAKHSLAMQMFRVNLIKCFRLDYCLLMSVMNDLSDDNVCNNREMRRLCKQWQDLPCHRVD